MKHKFIETIRFANGEAQLINYHQKRLERTQDVFYNVNNIKLTDILPDVKTNEEMKCRIIYSDKIEDIKLTPPQERTVNELVTVNADGINYKYKNANRKVFEKISEGLEEQQLPLIIKEGFITDTSISNVVVRIGDELITPIEPLLRGVQRQHLVDTGVVIEAPIPTSIIDFIDEIILINCMMPLANSIRLPKSAIKRQ
ncbi:MAG: aminotransferase class IV [Bacteroidales bacterium]